MGAYSMTERKLLTLDDFVKQPTTYTRFGEKVTRNPIEQVYNAGLLKDYKQLAVSHKYLKFTGMQEENDGGEGWYIRDDNITDDEDIGVIIYIGQYKYRRLYGAYVLVDWFYTGDFGIALQRACKYASVRCIAGKVYECNSEITLKLDVRGVSGKHGMIDYGHVIIDLRGATINYNVENSSFCFNIRIYNRETKFMLTNGTFNVSDLAKLTLKNIANVIGGNNYTDMLTDMHYNVDKELLPDTNRVVLFSDPTVEGVKTFTKSFNYAGDAVSADDNHAVTKDYMPAAVDESLYIAINDERELNVVTFSTNFISGGNVATENNITAVVNSLSEVLVNLVKNITNNIFYPGMYYAAIDSEYLYLPYPRLEYIKESDYTVNVLENAEYAFIPSALEFDEQFIGLPIYNEIRCNKEIVVPKSSLVSEVCESTEQLLKESLIPAENITNTYIDYYDTFTFNGTSVNYYVYDTDLLDGNNSPIKYIAYSRNKVFVFVTSDGKQYAYANLLYYDVCSYGIDAYNVGQHFYAISYVSSYNTKFFDSIGMMYQEYRDLKGDNKVLIPLINNNKLLAIIEIINPAGYYRDWKGGANITYVYPDTSKPARKLPTPAIICENMLVTKVAADNINILADTVAGGEYISIRDKVDIYVKNYIENEDDTVSFRVFYVKAIVPVQANMQVFNSVNSIIPTAKYKLRILYNNELYHSSVGSLYIPRFKIEYPHFQSINLAAADSKDAIAKSYNSNTLFTNPLLTTLKYITLATTSFATNLAQIPTYGTHYNRNQDEKDGSGCQCYQRNTSIMATWLDSGFMVKINIRGNIIACDTLMHQKTTISKYNTFTFNLANIGDSGILEVMFSNSIARYIRNTYAPSTSYCSNLSAIGYSDITTRSYYLESTVPSCGKCDKHNCPPKLSGSGIPGCWFYYLDLFIGKIRMWNYIFGTDAWRGLIYRDGNLKNPYKDRGSRPEYTRTLPIYPYKE